MNLLNFDLIERDGYVVFRWGRLHDSFRTWPEHRGTVWTIRVCDRAVVDEGENLLCLAPGGGEDLLALPREEALVLLEDLEGFLFGAREAFLCWVSRN